MNTQPEPAVPESKPALVCEHVKGDSRILHLSVRSVVLLLFVVTLCFVVGVIAIRIKEPEAMVSALKEVFLPTLGLVVVFYFGTKSPNKEGTPKP